MYMVDEPSEEVALPILYDRVLGSHKLLITILKNLEPEMDRAAMEVASSWRIAWHDSSSMRWQHSRGVLERILAASDKRQPCLSTREGLKAFRLANFFLSKCDRARAAKHADEVHRLCEDCQNTCYGQCETCVDACTNPLPGDRVYNDWLMCGDCKGCKKNLTYHENKDGRYPWETVSEDEEEEER
jgi:hypothetical protein